MGKYIMPVVEQKDEQIVLAAFKRVLADAVRARQSHMERWLYNRRMRNCHFNNEGKKIWQSIAYSPKIPEMIESRKKAVSKVYEDAPFKCRFKPGKGGGELAVQIAEFATRQVDTIFYRQEIGDLIEPLVEDLVTTGLCILKISTRESNEAKLEYPRESLGLGKSKKATFYASNEQYICIEQVLPEDLLLDPDGKDSFRIQRSYLTKDDLFRWANSDDSINKKAIKDLKPRTIQMDSIAKQLKKEDAGYYYDGNDSNLIAVDEFWGDLYDSEGEVIMRNGFLVVANEQTIIRKPENNPFWKGIDPFIIGKFTKQSRSVYPDDAIKHYIPLWLQMNKALNQVFDKMTLTMPMAEVRPHLLSRASSVAEGITPGGTYELNRQARMGENAINFVTPNITPYQDFSIIERVRQEISGMDGGENALQTPTTRRTTAKEFQGRAALAMEEADGLVRSFDKQILSPLASKVWILFAQYMPELVDYSTVELLDEVTGTPDAINALRFAAMDDAVRYELFADSDISVKVGALIEVLKTQADPQKIKELAMTGSKFPNLARRMDEENMWRIMARGLGLDPDEVTLSDERVAEKEQKQMEMIQSQMQMQQSMQPPEGNAPQMPQGQRPMGGL